MYDLCIANARIADEHGEFYGAIGIRDGRIAALHAGTPDAPAAETIDAGGLLLLPGLVDAHVHFNEPGRTDWEGFECGSMGAAAGGVTTVIDMPLNSYPAVVDGPTLLAKRAALAGRSVVDYLLWGGLVSDNVAQLAEQDAAGAVAYKAFMSGSGIDDFVAVTDGVLLDGLRHAAGSGKIVAVHAESEALTAHLTAQLRAAGRTDRRAWLESRPPLAEAEAISRALLLARAAEARLHIVHVSTAEGVELVDAARRAGQPVTCETCPHYLALDEDDFARIGPDASARRRCARARPSRRSGSACWLARSIRSARTTRPARPATSAVATTISGRPGAASAASRPCCRCCSTRASTSAACRCRCWRGWRRPTRRGCSASTRARARCGPAPTPTWR